MSSDYHHPNPIIDILRRVEPFATMRRRAREARHEDAPAGKFHYRRPEFWTYISTGFISDPRFAAAYKAGKDTGSWGHEIEWRVHVSCWIAEQAAQLPGDFVECGVNRGGISRSIVEYLDFNKLDKKFYLLDTFEGFPEDMADTAATAIPEGYYTECYEAARATFAPFPGCVLIRGAVPGTLPQVATEHVAYLSIDMNSAPPETAAMEYFLAAHGYRRLDCVRRLRAPRIR